MEEIWKDIYFIKDNKTFDYIGYYQVSNFGRIKTLERKDTNNHIVKEKIKSQRIDKDGYKIVTLIKKGEHQTFKVHRLVAYMFVPNPNNLPIVNHKNEIKDDNNANNLEFCTSKYNSNYGSGKLKISKRVNQYDINNNYIKTWNCISDINREFGYDVSCIVKCCKGKNKTAYGYKWKYVE